MPHDEPTTSTQMTAATPGRAPQLPDAIGPYKVLEYLGEGGFGLVYLAEQTQPFRRRVAVKVIKPGMDTRAVIARFEAERQALAIMSHAGIAKVLDAGETALGRPYFVMEYVRGERITNYCEKRQLSVQQRLRLLIRVCEAVHHAHTKGIIHRDLKPSNILVHEEDGDDLPKIIDFGVAKALFQPLTDQPVHTYQGQILGTRQYMSPEQADESNHDVDTRSDVYSLGVVLYQLLTGVTPHDPDTLAGAKPAELYSLLHDSEPLRPSRKLAAITRVDGAPSSASTGSSGTSAASSRITSELDWIAMKCLETDRQRRYSSAAALAEDLQRVLDDEPVVAAPPSRLYKLSKSLRRHRAAVLAGVLIVATLAAATIVSVTFAQREKAQRLLAEFQRELAEEQSRLAREQTEVAEQVLDFFSEEVLAQARPGQIGPDGAIKDLIDHAADRLDNEGLRSDVRQAVGATLSVTYALMGELRLADELADYSLKIAQERFGPADRRTLLALKNLAVIQAQTDREAAVRRLEQIERAQARLLGPDDPDTISTMSGRSANLEELGRPVEALPLSERVVEFRRAAFDRATEEERLPELEKLLISMVNHAELLGTLGERDWAARLAGEALELRMAEFGPKDPGTLQARTIYAKTLAANGEIDAACEQLRSAIALAPEIFGRPDHYAIGAMRLVLGEILLDSANPGEARAELEASLRIMEQANDRTRVDRALAALERLDRIAPGR